jgi:glutamate racemase
VKLFQHTCPGLVGQIEKGELDTPASRAILEDALHPMLEKNIDTVVLGCTHYPFVIPLIQQIVGETVRVIDPAPAVARQVRRLLETKNSLNDASQNGSVEFYTSGNANEMQLLLPKLLGEAGKVEALSWRNDLELNYELN